MFFKIKNLLKKYNVETLPALSKNSGISLNKLKNISSGRTSYSTLFKERLPYRIIPKRSKELAELTGIVLGDGNIFQFERCQRLTISCNGSHEQYIKHVWRLTKNIFKKEPSVRKRSKANCTDVCLYLQDIDKSLSLPVGNKIVNSVEIPRWIYKKQDYLKRCLKGLFETDGHYGSNKKFYVEYIQFCNKSESLKKSVFVALQSLGYSPRLGQNYVRLAKRNEVRQFIEEMDFVRPFPALAN